MKLETKADTPRAVSRAQHSEQRPNRSWAVLAVCCVAQFMVVLDVTIVNVALPQMRAGLHLSGAAQQWVINAYTLTFAGLLLLGGRAADLFGRRRVFVLGLSFFTGFSLLGGLAQNGAWLITARALQGAGAALLAPATLSLLTTTFVHPAEGRRALGAWSATAASGAAVGVLAGGVLTAFIGWRAVMFFNVPIGCALLVIALWVLRESRADDVPRHLDVPGAFAVTAGLAVLVYGIVSTDTHPWGSARTVSFLAIGVAVLGAFVVIEARLAHHPLVPLGVFRRRTLSVANVVAISIGVAPFSMFFFLSLYLQQINGYSPLRAGLAFLPIGLSSLFAARVAPKLVALLGVRRQLVIGSVLFAAGLVWMAQLVPDDSYWSAVFVPEILAGTGLGMSLVPVTLSATADMPAHQAGLASGLVNTSRQFGGAVGLAAMSTVAGAVHLHGIGHHAVSAALTKGYDRAFLATAGVLLAGALVALLLPIKLGMARADGTEEEELEPAPQPARAIRSTEASQAPALVASSRVAPIVLNPSPERSRIIVLDGG